MAGEIREIGYVGGAHPDTPVEVLDYQELVGRLDPRDLAAQRPDFGLLLLVESGRGTHHVDFESVVLRPGRLLAVRPGQVQRWSPAAELVAHVVVALPSLWRHDLLPGARPARDLDPRSMATALDLIAALRREQDRFTPDPVVTRLMADLFSVLVGLFERAESSAGPTALPPPFVEFCQAIEADLGRSRDARAYLRELPYAERTVNRACRRAVGLSAKGVLDRRLALEAKRLLAHTDQSVAAVAAELGFREPSNFNRFFRRLTGTLPSQFRRDLPGSGDSAGRR